MPPPAFTIGADDYTYDEARYTLTCRRCGQVFGPVHPHSDPGAAHLLMTAHDAKCHNRTDRQAPPPEAITMTISGKLRAELQDRLVDVKRRLMGAQTDAPEMRDALLDLVEVLDVMLAKLKQ